MNEHAVGLGAVEDRGQVLVVPRGSPRGRKGSSAAPRSLGRCCSRSPRCGEQALGADRTERVRKTHADELTLLWREELQNARTTASCRRCAASRRRGARSRPPGSRPASCSCRISPMKITSGSRRTADRIASAKVRRCPGSRWLTMAFTGVKRNSTGSSIVMMFTSRAVDVIDHRGKGCALPEPVTPQTITSPSCVWSTIFS